MPTLTEVTEPKVVKEPKIGAKAAPASSRPAAQPLPQPQRMLFADSLIDLGSPERRRRGVATTFSFFFQCLLLGALVILPLMFTQALPSAQLLTFLVAPPPPPPPPPPAAAPLPKTVQTDIMKNGELRTPSRIPRKIQMIREEQAPPQVSGGVVGGIPGGVPGGQLGGVIGGIISSSNNNTAMIPKLEPVKRIRISQGVTQGMLISKIEPGYPKLALAARINGVVMLKAVISREGNIQELQVVSGHPILVPAALEAVKQWRYRPYLLNGEPVEVETNIMVTFQISN
jgi:periplasmic protein TonB